MISDIISKTKFLILPAATLIIFKCLQQHRLTDRRAAVVHVVSVFVRVGTEVDHGRHTRPRPAWLVTNTTRRPFILKVNLHQRNMTAVHNQQF